jgi:hypothetical protein
MASVTYRLNQAFCFVLRYGVDFRRAKKNAT